MTVRITALSLLACPTLLLSANHGCETGAGGFLTNGAYTLVTPERMSETDAFATYTFLTSENLIRWTGDFEALSKMVAHDKVQRRNLERLRYNIDHALLLKYPGIKKCERKGLIAYDAIERRIRDAAQGIAEVCFAPRHEKKCKAFIEALEKKLVKYRNEYTDEKMSAALQKQPQAMKGTHL